MGDRGAADAGIFAAAAGRKGIEKETGTYAVGFITELKRGLSMIAIGADHGGYRIKEAVKAYLESRNIPVKDFSTYSEESVNYAPITAQVAKSVSTGECEKGCLLYTS